MITFLFDMQILNRGNLFTFFIPRDLLGSNFNVSLFTKFFWDILLDVKMNSGVLSLENLFFKNFYTLTSYISRIIHKNF